MVKLSQHGNLGSGCPHGGEFQQGGLRGRHVQKRNVTPPTSGGTSSFTMHLKPCILPVASKQVPHLRSFSFSPFPRVLSDRLTMSTAQESRPFSRAVRKIKVAAAVTSLAKSWQNWANEHTGKQETIPSGWIPDSIIQDENERNEVKLLVTPRVVVVNSEDEGNSKIKTGTVSKAIAPKRSECGHDLVSSIKEKIHANQVAPEEPKTFLGNESPTRRRHCGWKASVLTKTLGQREERKMGSRSSSLDTEDSGLGEDAALSDNSDQSEVEQKKPVSRPKVGTVYQNKSCAALKVTVVLIKIGALTGSNE